MNLKIWYFTCTNQNFNIPIIKGKNAGENAWYTHSVYYILPAIDL